MVSRCIRETRSQGAVQKKRGTEISVETQQSKRKRNENSKITTPANAQSAGLQVYTQRIIDYEQQQIYTQEGGR